VETPLVNDRAHVVEAVAVGSPAADFPGTGERALGDFSGGDRLAPSGPGRGQSAARGELPFLARGKAPAPSRLLTEPDAVGHGLIPRHADDRLERRPEVRIVPPRRRLGAAGSQEFRVLSIRHRLPNELEREDLDATNKAICLADLQRSTRNRDGLRNPFRYLRSPVIACPTPDAFADSSLSL